MRKKILRVIMLTVYIILIIVCAIFIAQMLYMRNSLIVANKAAGDGISKISRDAMSTQAIELLTQTSESKAALADREFSEFADSIRIIADSAADVYSSPDNYGDAVLEPYDGSDMGKIVTYAAYGEGVDPASEDIINELAMIANLQGMMTSVNESNRSVETCYYASESGIFLGNEKVSEYNLPQNGEELSFEARQRPWYKGAVENKAATFTGIIEDFDTGKYAISCGIPVYADNELKGVAGSGMYLDTIGMTVDGFRIGANGYGCIINDKGQILFSGADSGEMAAAGDDSDLRNSGNPELAALVTKALSGNSGVELISVDNESYYISYSPMATVGWSYVTLLPEEEVVKPSKELLNELDARNEQQSNLLGNSVTSTVKLLLAVIVIIGLIAAIVAVRFADRLARPVVKLTDSVRQIEGDNLDFKWEENTSDEVQMLATSFESMTGRMKQYIEDITKITAEKERIGAELSVATHIQASMLPSIFPPYPDRKEFDLYAKMDPAKEVGGDFYDFFFTDDDHIALVMADVSGKGVPAALFMVIAKTLIKNHAQSGESIEDILINTNNQLCEGNSEDMFVTAWIGIVDLKTGKLSFADAGHEYPYIINPDGEAKMIHPAKKKMPLGAIENMKYVYNETVLNIGDTLFLYTDGVPEATNADNEMYSTDRLTDILKAKHNSSPEELLGEIRRDVDAFVGDAPQFDDLTMLAFRFKELS